jgi:carboxylesterase type B
MIRALMASTKTNGLFKRAILQSDPMNYPLESRHISRDVIGANVLTSLNCSDVTCARSKSVSDIVSATSQICATGMSLDPMVPVTPLSPTIDGTWVKGDFSQLVLAGSLPMQVPIIMGISHGLQI